VENNKWGTKERELLDTIKDIYGLNDRKGEKWSIEWKLY